MSGPFLKMATMPIELLTTPNGLPPDTLGIRAPCGAFLICVLGGILPPFFLVKQEYKVDVYAGE